MGKNNQVDKLAPGLIGLVMGAFLLAGPQAGWAQEDSADAAPAAEEGAPGEDTAADAREDSRETSEARQADESDAASGTDETAQTDETAPDETAPDEGAQETAQAESAPPAQEEANAENEAGESAQDEEPALEDAADGTAQTDEAAQADDTARADAASVAENEEPAASEGAGDAGREPPERRAAAETTGSDAAPAEEAAPGTAGAPEMDSFAGTNSTEEPTPESETGATSETASPANALPGAADGEEAAASPEPAADEAGDTAPAEGTQADGADIPANSTSGATPARARDPIIGSSDPLEDYEPGPLEGEDEGVSARDPLEGMNRAFFKFNDFMDKLLLKPTAEVYRFVFPDYVQDRIRNVVNNADSPVILANDILQWKWKRAWHTTSRFFINTTLGIAGIWDVATSFGIDRHDEDFGQTLCVWGAGEWFYLYLPFVGPTNPRDMVGKGVDRFFDPLSYYADTIRQVNLSDGVDIKFNIDRAGMAQIALTAADLIDMRARNIETINEIERTSIDFYTAVRSLYRQSRESACKDGQVDFEELPDLSDEFE